MNEHKQIHPELYRDCPKCKNPVHMQSRACKLCGAPSPWLAMGESGSPAGPHQDTAAGEPATVAPGKPTGETSTPAATSLAPIPENAPAMPVPRNLGVFSVEPHVVLKPFTHQFGDVLGIFKAGDVVSDFQTITKLRAAGQPIAPASEVDNVTSCPDCGKVFVPKPIPRRGKVA